MTLALPHPSRLTLAFALACAALAAGPVVAQSSPGGFQLPTPTPTPTPVPQGPADERAGVPIAPRIIPEERIVPEPTPTPTPTPTPVAPPPASEPTSAAESPSPAASPSAGEPASQRPPAASSGSDRPSQGSSQSQTNTPPSSSVRQPASPPDSEIAEPATAEGSTTSIGPDDWYSVDELGTENEAGSAFPSLGAEDAESPAGSAWGDAQKAFTQSRNLAFGAVMAILILGVGLFVWRRRKLAREALALPAPALAAGVRRSLAATQGSSEAPKAAEAPPPPPAPLEVDLSLEIVSASRSVMMFMIEYRLTVSNRSDRAARDIALTTQLTCAQRGGTNGPPVAGGQPLELIERIGPHQSRSVSGQLQMPLTEVQAIRQGQKPIFIPLLHVSLVSAGDQSLTRSFVVGEPSAASQGRVHPIRLDTPPGGIPGLRAREVSLETA